MAVGNIGASGTDRVAAARSNQHTDEVRADNDKRQTRAAEAPATPGSAEQGQGEKINLQA